MLRTALNVNAGFSFFSGAVMLTFNDGLQSAFGFDNDWVFPIVGLHLMVFGVFVAFVAKRKHEHKGLVSTITLLDLGWVIGSTVLVLFQPFGLNPLAHLIISGVAGWIGLLAFLQWKYRP